MSSAQNLLNPGVNIFPKITKTQCEEFLLKLYGKKCREISELNGYDDRNYKICDQNGQKFVCKILNSLDSKKTHVIEAQNDMLLFLGKRNVKCPQPVATKTGGYYSMESLVSGQHLVRLLEFIEGNTLHEVKDVAKPELYYKIGQFLANLNTHLEEFQRDAYYNHRSVWMLDCVPQLRNFMFVLKDADKKEEIEKVIEEFEVRVLQQKANLSQGLIHGDFNEQNVLVDKEGREVVGLLDFADAQHSCYIYEVAIAMAYMIIVSEDLSMGGLVFAGYNDLRPLSQLEVSLLRLCILARMSQSLVMGAYSSHLNPENSEYLLVSSKEGWKLFHEMYNKNEAELVELWTTAKLKLLPKY